MYYGSFPIHAFQAAEAWHEALNRPKPAPTPVITEKNPAWGRVEWDKKRAYEGYTLLSYHYSTIVNLVDMEGNVVHHWDMPFEKAWPNPKHVHTEIEARIFIETAHVFPNGDLLAQHMGFGDTPYGYGIVKMDKDSNVLWTYDQNAHHDFTLDAQGNIYTLVHAIRSEPLPGLESLYYPMLVDYIVKLSPNGKELMRISIAEAFRDSPFALLLESAQSSPKGVPAIEKWDPFHTNTIRVLDASMAAAFPQFKPDSLLISPRNLNVIAVIDVKTRKVVWAYNGGWRWQHGARFLPNGHMLVLDNLGYQTAVGDYSKIVEFDPKTLGVAWYFAGRPEFPMRSVAYGRVERLPNGNTLVAAGLFGKALEITPEGDIAWSYSLRGTKNQKVTGIVTATRYEKNARPFLNDKKMDTP